MQPHATTGKLKNERTSPTTWRSAVVASKSKVTETEKNRREREKNEGSEKTRGPRPLHGGRLLLPASLKSRRRSLRCYSPRGPRPTRYSCARPAPSYRNTLQDVTLHQTTTPPPTFVSPSCGITTQNVTIRYNTSHHRFENLGNALALHIIGIQTEATP